MATEQREEGVTCSICLDVLVRPLVLQCQHVVCRPCFLDYLEANAKHPYQQGWTGGSAVCPLGRCEIPFAVPPINTTLQHLVETRHPKDVQDRIAALPPAEKEARRAQALLRRHGLLLRPAPRPRSPFDDGDDGLLSEIADCLGGRDPLGGSTCAGPTLLVFVFGMLLLYNTLPSVRRHDELSAAKPVWATRQRFSGMDFGCGDDSEGDSRAACQIRCGTPCIEPFLQCQLHAHCHAVFLNAEGSYGTLKTGIPQLGPWWPLTHARKCLSRREWRAWLGKSAEAEAAEHAEELPRAHRPVMLAIEDVRDHDFACHEGANAEACQVKCDDEACVAAYRRCLAHAACVAIHVNGERTFGTLKEGIQDGQEIIAVLSEAEWMQQMRPQLEGQWRKHHRTSKRQHAMLPGEGAPHAAPYWRLQPHAAPPGLFSLLGGL